MNPDMEFAQSLRQQRALRYPTIPPMSKLTAQPCPKPTSALELEEYFKAINITVPQDRHDDEVDAMLCTAGLKFDGGKLDYTLLPFGALEDVVAVLGFGAVKYGRDNWQKVDRQRYVAAAFRHLVEIAKGNLLDDESGKSHAAHLSCCSLFIGEMDRRFK